MKTCTHKTHLDHQTGAKDPESGKTLWRCSGCGKVGRWTGSWSYFGSIECRHCWVPDMESVACSDACRAKCERSCKPDKGNAVSASQKRNARTERPERRRRDNPERLVSPDGVTASGWLATYGEMVNGREVTE